MPGTVDERFKLLYYPKIERTQLFDLENDPHETNDLPLPWRRQPISGTGKICNLGYTPAIEAERVDAVAEKLKAVLSGWQSQNGDEL